MDTPACKAFIENTVNASPVLQEELRAHEADRWDATCWKRSEKKKVRDEGELDWIREIPEDMGKAPPVDMPLTGCILRGFLYNPDITDSYFCIITDPTDTTIVAWAFQID